MSRPEGFPKIAPVGLCGMAIRFSASLSEQANRAALAFRAGLEKAGWEGVEEVSTSLTSAFVRFDPLRLSHDGLEAQLRDMLDARDWYGADLPGGRKHFRIPCVLGTELGPQFGDAAAEAGLSEAQAREELCAARPRVLTIGFAPGQPYTGELPAHWDIPRLKELTPKVPQGALVVAIRQLIIFANDTPTGWRHIGQTAFRCFCPEADEPFALRPGDEISLRAIDAEELHAIRARDRTGLGGAEIEVIE